jgi:hypothetical protein
MKRISSYALCVYDKRQAETVSMRFGVSCRDRFGEDQGAAAQDTIAGRAEFTF